MLITFDHFVEVEGDWVAQLCKTFTQIWREKNYSLLKCGNFLEFAQMWNNSLSLFNLSSPDEELFQEPFHFQEF